MGSFRYAAFHMQHAKVVFRLSLPETYFLGMELCPDKTNEKKYHTVCIKCRVK